MIYLIFVQFYKYFLRACENHQKFKNQQCMPRLPFPFCGPVLVHDINCTALRKKNYWTTLNYPWTDVRELPCKPQYFAVILNNPMHSSTFLSIPQYSSAYYFLVSFILKVFSSLLILRRQWKQKKNLVLKELSQVSYSKMERRRPLREWISAAKWFSSGM